MHFAGGRGNSRMNSTPALLDENRNAVWDETGYFGYQLIDPPVMRNIMTAAKPLAAV